jgi:IS605 OrfB family transposase
MFKTFKIPIQLSNESKQEILDIQRQYSNMFRFAYNRFLEGKTEKEIRSLSKDLKSVELLNSWLIQCAILDAKGIFKRLKDEKVVFGGKNLFKKLHQKLITKEEFKLKRLRPIDIQGEKIQNGNRMFNLNFLDGNSITLKVNKNLHIEIILPNLRKNLKKLLWKLEEQAKLKEVTYTVKLTSEFISISFETKDTIKINHVENRAVGIDLNPNFIGISILEFGNDDKQTILDKVCFDIRKLTKKSGLASSDPKSIYLQNKLQFETIEITKKILHIAKQWNVAFVFLEDLNFKQKDSGLGSGFNRLTKNKWLKGLFQEQLKKRLDLFGFKYFNINPMYSSVVGNLQHDSFDPVNAAIEICRRGFNYVIRKNKKFYPAFEFKSSFLEQWKQTKMNSLNGWPEFFKVFKNSKLKYRVSLKEVLSSFKVFRLNSKKSNVKLFCFT